MQSEGKKKQKQIKSEKEKKNNATPSPITREQIIKSLQETNFIPSYIRRLAHHTDGDFIDDLEQEIWVVVCGLSDEKLKAIYNGNINNLRRYVAGVIHRQIKSTTSAYYRTYKRPFFQTDKNTTYTLAEKEELNLFTPEWYDEVNETDFTDKIKI